MHSNTATYMTHQQERELDAAAKVDIQSLPSFSPSERSPNRRRTSTGHDGVTEHVQTPRKHSLTHSSTLSGIQYDRNGSPSTLPETEVPSTSTSEPCDSLPKQYLSDFGLVRKLLLNQLLNNDYTFLERLMLWNGASDREDHMSVTTLRSLRNMLMKDEKHSRFILRGDQENSDGTHRVVSSIQLSKHLAGRTSSLMPFNVGVPEHEVASDRSKGDGNVVADAMEADALERIRAQVWEFMENPGSSRAAYVVSVSILVLILLSSVTFCLETVESLDHARPTFHAIEVFAVVCFTVEYTIRIASAPALFPFIRAPLNIIDLVAILPFYIEMLGKGLGLGSTQVLRVIRLVRVFRVLKLGSKSGRLEVIIHAVSASTDMLIMLTFLLLLSMIVFSSLIYFAEKNTYNESSGQFSFKSIPDSFWWCMVTLMTVGYGDAVPETPLGRLIATMTMLASIIILALPISVIGTNFTSQWIVFKDQFKTRDRAHVMRARFSRSRRLIAAYRMSIDDLVKELGRASRRIEEKSHNVRMRLNKASVLFRIADSRGQAVHDAETPASSKAFMRSSSTTADGEKKDEDEEYEERDEQRRAEVELHIGDGSGAAGSSGGDGSTPPQVAAESPETVATEKKRERGEDKGGAEEKASADQKEVHAQGQEEAQEQGSPTWRPTKLSVPRSDSGSDPISRQDSFNTRTEQLVAAHEALLESIRDLEETRMIYDELVHIAEMLTAQKGIVTLEFCVQKHKRLSKTMDEVDVVETAVEDMFEEYDHFLEQLNT